MTMLTITGRRIFPKKSMKKKDINKRIAKYTDSSFEKKRLINLLNKFFINNDWNYLYFSKSKNFI